MVQYEKTGTWGGAGLIVTLTVTKVLISAPSLYAKQSASAGWLEVLLSGVFELLVLAIVLKLFLQFENMDIIDISQYALGNIGRILTGSVCCAVFVISSAAVFRSFGELIRNTVIRGISYENVAFFLIIVGIFAGYLGFKTIVSINGLVLPFVLVAILIIMLINIPRYAITNILPIWGNGLDVTIKNAVLKNASFYEVGIILFLYPYLREKISVKKIGFTALLLSIVLTSVITLLYQLSVPYEAAGTFALPLYQMTRMIKAGTFFQRIEPLNVFIWSGVV
ncbi:MAG: GerAB/ArcD/ProY family transporter, partial [Clostridia bacterium]|nr:GerAB/ArcD/ProY family transporter [Clostridia bacterium]